MPTPLSHKISTTYAGNKIRITYIGTAGEWHCEEVDKLPTYEAMRNYIAGSADDPTPDIKQALIEHVSVWHNESAAHLFIHESGAVRNPPLPINAVATLIYRNNSIVQRMINAAYIHGPAILVEGTDDV